MQHRDKSKPYVQNPQNVVIILKSTNSTSIPSSEAGIASGGEEPSGVPDTTLEEVPIHGGKTTSTAPRLEAVNTVGAMLTKE